MILDIANREVEIISQNEQNIIRRVAGLKMFLTDRTYKDQKLIFETDQKIELPAKLPKPIHSFYSNNQRCTLSKIGESYIFDIEENDEYPNAKFILSNNKVLSNIDSNKLSAPHLLGFSLWMAYNLFIINQNAITIHASTIVFNNTAILFLGESGTGKSTHSNLWEQHFPGSYVLNDDSPVIAIENDQILIYGSPWSGKGRRFHNQVFPLKAIVRIEQAPFNKIETLSKLHAIGAVLPSLPPSFAYDDQLLDLQTNILSTIISKTNVYKLKCLPNLEAAQTSHDGIYNTTTF